MVYAKLVVWRRASNDLERNQVHRRMKRERDIQTSLTQKETNFKQKR